MTKKRTDKNKTTDHYLERVFGAGLSEIMPNLIWQNSEGVYEVFARYRIQRRGRLYLVSKLQTPVGVFSSSRTALSWCIADKFLRHRLAAEILSLDTQLQRISDDLAVRQAVVGRSNNPQFRESVMTKLETKVARKKQIECEINKCIGTARQCQNQGFNNETNRTVRKTTNRQR